MTDEQTTRYEGEHDDCPVDVPHDHPGTDEQTTHTNGPWTTGSPHEVTDNAIRVYGSDAPDYSLVAEVHFTPAGGEGEGEANARLIAAAPDLLNACYDAADHLTERGDNIGLLSDLLNVIAKAVGSDA